MVEVEVAVAAEPEVEVKFEFEDIPVGNVIIAEAEIKGRQYIRSENEDFFEEVERILAPQDLSIMDVSNDASHNSEKL
jgi:hypothetical protein